MSFTIGIDTGSTFTDGVVVDTKTGDKVTMKVLTTHYDLTESFSDILVSAAEKFNMPLEKFLENCGEIRYSHTIATNTVITKTGTKLGLIVTEGNEEDLYGGISEIMPFINRNLVFGVKESTDSSGKILKKIDENQVREVIEKLIDLGARAIVVSLKNSFYNSEHEDLIYNIVRDEYPPQYLGKVPTFLSHEAAKTSNDAVRTATSLIGAYVHRSLSSYLYRAEDYLRKNTYKKPLLLVNSDGTLSTIPWTRAMSSIGSGPSAGVYGSLLLAKQLYGIDNVATMDLGGTSFDIAFLEGSVDPSYYSDLEGMKIFQPMVQINSVAVGGSSISRAVNSKLQVGPESVGSSPGPASFDRGGEMPTPVDADLVLGYLTPANFLGGRIQVDVEKARNAIKEKVADPLGLTVMDAAYEIRKEAERKMTDSLNDMLSGQDKPVTAFLYGGGGALHVSSILKGTEKIESAYVFPFSPEFSALGCCMLDISRSYYAEFTPGEETLGNVRKELMERANKDIEGEGYKEVVFEEKVRAGDSVFQFRNNSEITGKLSKLQGPFVYILTWKVQTPKPSFPEIKTTNPIVEMPPVESRQIHWNGSGLVDTPVYRVENLKSGMTINGPTVLESADNTIVLEPGITMKVDRFGNFDIRRA